MSDADATTLNAAQLRDCFEAGRFELLYQPQHSARDGKLVGVEALVRLRASRGELVLPSRFISAVERTPLIHDLGADLFARGCAAASSWPNLTVAINVSPVQFRDPGLARRLDDLAERAGAVKRRIEIEITEGLFFDHPDRAKATLLSLREAGFSIALDDFGTGYSSLSYLLRFPVDKIKIDRSFIVDAPDSTNSATIVHALVALARALGLKIVAEGVETEAQRVFLRTAGCHYLQGYLFGAPMPEAAISALIGPVARHHPAA